MGVRIDERQSRVWLLMVVSLSLELSEAKVRASGTLRYGNP